MPFIKTKNGRLFYKVQGEGPALLLIPGLGRSARHWLGFEKILASHHTVITTDSRGVGRSQAPLKWADTTKELADDLVAILDHLEIESVHVFGLSLGGMIAISLAALHPSRVKSMIIANSSVGGLGQLRLYPQVALGMIWGAIRPNQLHDVMAYFCTCRHTAKKSLERFVRRWRKIDKIEQASKISIAKQLLIASRFSSSIDLRNLKTPGLIVTGEQDRFVPPSNSKAISEKLPHGSLLVLSQAGHEITPDKPDELAEAIGNFIELHDR